MIHRSLKTLPVKRIDKIFNVFSFFILIALTFYLNEFVFSFWNSGTNFILDFLQIPYTTEQVTNVFPLADITYPSVSDTNPTTIQMIIGTLICLFLWFGLKIVLPKDHWLPLHYFGKFLSLLIGFSVIYFLVAPASFPYSLHYYSKSFFNLNFVLMLLINIVHVLTFYILTGNIRYKLSLTFLSQLFLLIWTPLNLSIHIYLIYNFSSLYLPMLSIVFSILINILFFIALFGWACSWIQPKNNSEDDNEDKTLDSKFMTPQ